MRDSLQITRKYQFGYMILRHYVAVFICFVFEAVAFYAFLAKAPGQYIVSAVFTVVYAFLLYGSAVRLSEFDAKAYTPLKSNLKYGILWGVAISGVILIHIVIYKVNWIVFGTEDGLSTLLSMLLNLMFYIFTAPFYGFSVNNSGNIPIYAIAIMLIMPIISCGAGYFAGMKRFDLIQKLDEMTFEKDDDKQ